VGKQSAALRRPTVRGAGEDLQELPASVAEQLLTLESAGAPDAGFRKPGQARPAEAAPPKPAAEAPAAPPVQAPPPAQAAAAPKAGPQPAAAKAAAPKPGAPEKRDAGPRWTLQLVSTPDAAEAQRMAAKAKAAGFPTATVSEKGLFKVRLAAPGAREAVDATAQKLKNRGFKPFAIKVE
jgi:hypothetical protein